MEKIPVSLRHRAPLRWLAALLVFAGCTAFPLAARAQYAEYEVKAAFLANFAQFVKWPPAAFAEAGAPFVIGILGDDPFGAALEKIVKGQTVAGRKIVIRRGRRAEEMRACHVVFIGKSERSRIAEHLAGFQGANMLTVGETEQFARQGGVIGFMMEGDKVRFEINAGTAQRAGLELSSRLLKLARASP